MNLIVLGILSALGIWAGKNKEEELRYVKEVSKQEHSPEEAEAAEGSASDGARK